MESPFLAGRDNPHYFVRSSTESVPRDLFSAVVHSKLRSRNLPAYATYNLSETRDRRGSSRDNTDQTRVVFCPPTSASLILRALDGMP